MEGNIMKTRNGSIKSSLSGSRGRGDSMCCAGRGARDSGPEATGTGSRCRGDLHQFKPTKTPGSVTWPQAISICFTMTWTSALWLALNS